MKNFTPDVIVTVLTVFDLIPDVIMTVLNVSDHDLPSGECTNSPYCEYMLKIFGCCNKCEQPLIILVTKAAWISIYAAKSSQ